MKSEEVISGSGKYREKAENILKKKLSDKSLSDTEVDSIRLNHELQVHQIELELINDELLKSKELAEATAEKYSELYYAPMGYFTLSKKNEIIDVNPTGAQMLGVEQSSLLNRSFSLFVSEESKSVFDLFINRIFKNKIIQTCDIKLTLRDKSPIYVYMNGLINGSKSVCHLIAIDITERRKAEKEYQRILLELSSAQTKLNVALESGNIGIWEWDLDSGELIVDEKAGKLFRRKSGSFGKSVSAFDDLIHQDDIAILRTAYKNATENNHPFESIIRTREDTGSKYLNIRAYIRRDADGNAIRFTGVCYDVTPLKETENTILKLNEDLLRSNRDLESFAYVASHDLQEPLRMVSSFMQLLSMKYEKQLDKDAQEYIGFAVEGAKRMYDLLNGLLTYSRVTSGGAEFAKVNMNKVLESVMKNLNLIIKERKAVIKSDVLPVIIADENQMVQLLQNLITNAIKFNQNPPEIFIEAELKDQNFVFSVRDNGPGIEEQYFERIFGIFQRLVPRDNVDGIGIGLSICKRIVERHKGSIWVESKHGQGASFFFTIPNL